MRDRRGDDELTAQERAGYEALQREADPGDLLEERVVRALRAENLLGDVRRTTGDGRTGRPFPPWSIAVAGAASLVLFLGGLLLGQWMGSRATADALLAVREQDAALFTAVRIQEAGTAYVQALATLAELRESGRGPQVEQGTEAAVSALLAAAELLARLEPEDPTLAGLPAWLEAARAGGETSWDARTERIVWF